MEKMNFALMSCALLLGCSQLNPNHCSSSSTFCANNGAANYCNDKSGICVLPLGIESVVPAILTADSKVATINGKGFQEIVSIKSKDTEVLKFANVKSMTQIEMDLGLLRSAPEGAPVFAAKCGPVPFTITRKDEVSATASELTGGSFNHWKYQKPYSTAALVASNIAHIADFAFANFDKTTFDGVYYSDNLEVGALSNPQLKPLTVVAPQSLDSKVGLINSVVEASPKKIFTLHNSALLTVGFLSNQSSMKTDVSLSALCDADRRLVDQKPLNSAVAKRLILACAGVTNPLLLNVKQFDLLTKMSSLSLSNSQFTKPVRAVAYAPNDSDCGVALLATSEGVAPNTIAPFCTNSNLATAPEKPIEIPLAGLMESVASANARDSSTGTSRHYVLSKNGESLVMEVFDALRMSGGMPGLVQAPVTPIVFNAIDTGSFSVFGAKIEVTDLNCDNIPDVIVKTDSRVIAYLAIDAARWETKPKVLFEMPSTAPGVTIKKAALWIPDYGSPQVVGVLGILDSTGNLSLYQQQ